MPSVFHQQLIQSSTRIAGTTKSYTHALDKNEHPDDIPVRFKEQLHEVLLKHSWNRYPAIHDRSIEEATARYCGLQADEITLGPGSAAILTTLLNYFAVNQRELVIVQPSYSLFEFHCQTYNIPFTPWLLNDALDYDEEHLPVLSAHSVLIVASPNNPSGNSISPSLLKKLLELNPRSLIIVDAVYAELGSYDFTSWVKEYSNLLVIRSFSKAFPAAGFRLGYCCGSPELTSVIRKLMLPFSLNPFTLAFAQSILFTGDFQQYAKEQIQQLKVEREMVFQFIQDHFYPEHVMVYPSEGNFLLLRVMDDTCFLSLMNAFDREGIKVLNTSSHPLLKNTFRISVGTEEANDSVLSVLLEQLPVRKDKIPLCDIATSNTVAAA